MDIRKNAIDLTDAERDAFLEALLRLKQKPAVDTSQPISVYDQFVALHGAVMQVLTPHAASPVNFGHGDIGFLPWHRQYLRDFELALQAEVPGVTLPYWDWSDTIDVPTRLFSPEFLSSVSWGSPRPVSDGVLRQRMPASDRPDWWPDGLRGFEVDSNLEEGRGPALLRGSMEADWPPAQTQLQELIQLTVSIRGAHPLWPFWLVIEAGHQAVTERTHNAGHRFIGGHMAGAFSPNDPVFWLHHANVDRLWSLWQDNQATSNPGSSAADSWPMADEISPFSGRQAPAGHRLDDVMWPWVADATGYRSVSVSQALLNRLADYSQRGAVRVGDVLDFRAMDFSYA